jgi:uncharacterized integral membrane protein (TIGR00698 family)
MPFRRPQFRRGVALTTAVALLAIGLSHLPGLSHIGALSLALLLGLAVRGCWDVPAEQATGITFSARHLLRIGIVLIGVRLNFDLLMQAGPRIFILAASIIITGLCVITWLGRRCGLPGMQALLLAVDSSICGASAAAAAAPVIRARQEDIALVVPICSLIGTFGLLSLACVQHLLDLTPTTFGILSGATLHEVAQVMAAASIVPQAMEAGTVTKLMRVALLAPAVLILGVLVARGRRGEGCPTSLPGILGAVWFVFGFLAVGAIHTLICMTFPDHLGVIEKIGGHTMTVASFLMTIAMAGLGLQVDFAQLRKNALRTTVVALAGWLLLVALASVEIRLLHLH